MVEGSHNPGQGFGRFGVLEGLVGGWSSGFEEYLRPCSLTIVRYGWVEDNHLGRQEDAIVKTWNREGKRRGEKKREKNIVFCFL